MSEDLNSFHTTDWIILVVYIVFCLAVGIYTGKSGDDDKGKSSGAEDYLLAGKQKHFLVVAVSLVSGLTSGISFLGSPGYSYTHGLSLGFSCFSVLIAAPVIMFIIMPFFGKLNLITAYSYLSLRFSNSIRLLASLVFTTRVVAYLGLVLFAPSIAIKALTGLHESVSVIVVGILTTAYTMKGGMNAVVWTDFIQSIVLIAITIYIVSKCLTNVSSRDFQDAVRVDSKFFEFDPTRELTFWSAVIGVGINSIAQGGTDQVAIQRYLTTSNMKQSIRACFFAWMMNGIYCGFLGITGVAL
jgi:Na+/proline symporter